MLGLLSIVVSSLSACSTIPERGISIENTNPQDLLIVDCLLPPQVRQLGTRLTYLAQRRAIRTSGADCALKGGEYVAYNRADFKTALTVWLPQAENGDPEAQTYVGEIYEKGLGTRASYELAANWYQRAANQDYSRAQINLGYLYESGLGVQRDLPRAMNLYRQASGFTAADIEFVSSTEIAQRKAVQMQSQELENQIDILQSEILASRKILDTQKDTLQENEDEILSLKESLTIRKSLTTKALNNAHTRKIVIQDHENKLEELETLLLSADNQKLSLLSQLESLAANTANLKEHLSATKGSLELLKHQRESNIRTIELLEAQIDTHTDDSVASFEALQNAKDQSAALAGKIVDLENKINQQNNKYSDLDTTTTASSLALMQQIEIQIATINRIERQQKDEKARYQLQLTQQNALLQQSQKERQRQLDQHLIQHAEDEQTILNLQQNLSSRETELAEKSSAIEELQRNLANKQADLQKVALGNGTETTIRQRKSGNTDHRRLPINDVKFGNYHALIIGNDTYASLGNLKTAGNDAIAVERVLREKYGFRTIMLLNANQKTIISALERMRTTLKKQDNLIIYYTGHGDLDKQSGRGYWLPIDSDIDNKDKWIANSAITSIIDTMNAKHVLVIADSCYSGALARSSIARPQSDVSADLRLKWLKAIVQSRVRTVLSSGSKQPIQNGSTNSKHSIFAEQLLDALERNTEVMETYELFYKLQQKVTQTATRLNVEQTPQYAPIRHAGHQAGEFILVPIAQTTVGSTFDRKYTITK